jgi:uncharacterized membrane protein
LISAMDEATCDDEASVAKKTRTGIQSLGLHSLSIDVRLPESGFRLPARLMIIGLFPRTPAVFTDVLHLSANRTSGSSLSLWTDRAYRLIKSLLIRQTL